MDKEFRFVIPNKEVLNKFNLNVSERKDFVDYYITRRKRIRHLLKTKQEGEHFYIVDCEPGSRIKQKKEITKRAANELIKNANVIVKKIGLGHIMCLGIIGYSENIIAYRKESRTPFLDEIHIEFEVGEKVIPALYKEIKPLKVIKKGIIDYINE